MSPVPSESRPHEPLQALDKMSVQIFFFFKTLRARPQGRKTVGRQERQTHLPE